MTTWKFSLVYMVASTVIILMLQIFTTLPVDASEEMIKEMETMYIIRDYIPIVFSLGLCGYYWKQMLKDVKENKLGESVYPTLMAAQGTFYTFVGISIILLLFTNHDATQLIGGLKLAFFTSAIGIMFSIVSKIYLKTETENYITKDEEVVAYYDENDFYRMLVKIHGSVDSQATMISKSVQDSLNKYDNNVEKNVKKLFDTMQSNVEKYHEVLMADLAKDVKAINLAMQDMKVNISSVNSELKTTGTACAELNKNLQKLKTKADRVTESLITNMDKVDEGIGKLVTATTTIDFSGYSNSIYENTNALIAQISTYKNILNNVSNKIDATQTGFERTFDGFENSVKNISDTITKTISEFASKSQESIQINVDAASEAVALYKETGKVHEQYISAYNRSMMELLKINDEQAKNMTAVQDNYKKSFDTHINMMNNSIGVYANRLDEFADTFVSNATKIADSLHQDNESLQNFGSSLVMDTDRLGDMLKTINNCVINTQRSIEEFNQIMILGRDTMDTVNEDYGLFVTAMTSLNNSTNETITLIKKYNEILSENNKANTDSANTLEDDIVEV